MSPYVEPGEVRTWYDRYGEGEPVVLLHPGGADARAWAPNLEALSMHFCVYTPERRGHGRSADVDGPITYELMRDDTIAFLEHVVGEPAHLVGCSAGAVVALHVALRRPDLARRVVLSAESSTETGGSRARSIRRPPHTRHSSSAMRSSRPMALSTSRS